MKIPFYIIKYILKLFFSLLSFIFGLIFGWVGEYKDKMSGEQFEDYVKEILKRNGYKNIKKTKASSDYGVDLLAEYKGVKYAIQCKKYATPVGVKALQEVYTGCVYYGYDEAIVVTNNTFTRQAMNLSMSNGVILWDGEKLERLRKRANRFSLFHRYKKEESDEHPYYPIISLLFNEGYASIQLLMDHYGYSYEKSYYILEDLEFYDLVSEADSLGIRDLLFETIEEANDLLLEGE